MMYLKPEQLINFFRDFFIPFNTKCVYDGVGLGLVDKSAKYVFSFFPNMVVRDVSVYWGDLIVLDEECQNRYGRKMCYKYEMRYSLYKYDLDHKIGISSMVICNVNNDDICLLRDYYSGVKTVVFYGCDSMMELYGLEKCLELSTVKMYLTEDCGIIHDDDAYVLSVCPNLINLELRGIISTSISTTSATSDISDISDISHNTFTKFYCKKLRSFKYVCDGQKCCFKNEGISLVNGCVSLRVLEIKDCCLKSMNGLLNYDLVRISLRGCTQLVDVSELGKCRKLKWLDLSWCVSLVDVRSLVGCVSLRVLKVVGCGKDLLEGLEMLNGLRIVYD